MSGHHAWSELTKHFTPEDRKTVKAGAAEIVADSDRRERRKQGRAGQAPHLSQPSSPAPPTRRSATGIGRDG